MTKAIKISLLLSLVYIGLIRFKPFWERMPEDFWVIVFNISIGILFLWICFKLIIEINNFVDRGKSLTFHTFIPVVILGVALADGIYNPFNVNLDNINGEVVFRACREGTVNTTILKLRNNGNFDVYASGFYSFELFIGTYERRADTIFLKFENRKPKVLDDTLIINNKYLYSIENNKLMPTYFYLGYCKGLN